MKQKEIKHQGGYYSYGWHNSRTISMPRVYANFSRCNLPKRLIPCVRVEF